MKELDRLLIAANTLTNTLANTFNSKEIVTKTKRGEVCFRFYNTVWLGILRIDGRVSSVALLDADGNVLNDDDEFADDCAYIGLDVVNVYDKIKHC